MNYQTPYLTEESLHTLCSYFDVALVQLRVITKTKKKFVEIVTERYLIITYLIQNKKSQKQLFRIYLPVKLVERKNVNKKGRSFIIPMFIHNLQNFHFDHRWLEKLNPFHERLDEYELVVKHL